MIASDEQIREIHDKVSSLVQNEFGGDFCKLFAKYANANPAGNITKSELVKFLGDAGVGNWLTRGRWADGILTELDKDKDDCISLAEFESALLSWKALHVAV